MDAYTRLNDARREYEDAVRAHAEASRRRDRALMDLMRAQDACERLSREEAERLYRETEP